MDSASIPSVLRPYRLVIAFTWTFRTLLMLIENALPANRGITIRSSEFIPIQLF